MNNNNICVYIIVSIVLVNALLECFVLLWCCMLEDGVFDDPVTIVYTERVLSKTEGQPSQR